MNICEGTGRGTDKDFARFLIIARGSLYETKYQLILSRDLGYIAYDESGALLDKCDVIGKLINSFFKKLTN